MTSIIPPTVFKVVRTLKDAGHQAFLVGGCVRDMLRGAAPHDFDIATSATPEQVVELFARTIPTGIAHGTVTVVMPNNLKTLDDQGRISAEPPTYSQVEVTTFRSEGAYTDGRRPDEVKFETDIVADLSRRDFTINAMAYDPTTGEMVDPFGGQYDLAKKLVRCVGDARTRFMEDGLRCMRAIRFASTLGFCIHVDTYMAIEPCLDVFAKVAMERVQSEFIKILMSPRPSFGLTYLRSTWLMNAIFKSGGLCDGFDRLDGTVTDLETRLAVLVRSNTNRAVSLAALKLPTAVIRQVDILLSHPLPREGETDTGIRMWLQAIGNDHGTIRRAIDMKIGVSEEMVARINRLGADPLFAKDLALNGFMIADVLGCKPGAVMGKAIKMLLNMVLADPKLNTQEALKAALKEGVDTGVLVM